MKTLLCPVCKLDLEPAHLAHICINVWRDALWVEVQLLKERVGLYEALEEL